MTTAVVAAVIMTGAAVPTAAAGSATRGYTVNRDTLVVIDPATNTVTDQIPLGFTARPTVRPDGREVYLTDSTNHMVHVFDTTTNTVVAAIAIGSGSLNVAFTPDSRRAYVSTDTVNASSVAVIDTTTRRVVRTIPTGENAFPVAVSPDGAKAYVGTSRTTGNTFVREIVAISTATDTITATITLPDLTSFGRIVFSRTGDLALVGSGAVIDTRADTVLRTIAMGWASDFEFTPDGRGVYIADTCAGNFVGALRVVDPRSGASRSLFTGRRPTGVTSSPDDKVLYVVLDGGSNVATVDPGTGTLLDVFGVTDPAGRRPLMRDVELTGMAPPAPQPGIRFAPAASNPLACLI